MGDSYLRGVRVRWLDRGRVAKLVTSTSANVGVDARCSRSDKAKVRVGVTCDDDRRNVATVVGWCCWCSLLPSGLLVVAVGVVMVQVSGALLDCLLVFALRVFGLAFACNQEGGFSKGKQQSSFQTCSLPDNYHTNNKARR